MKMLNNYDKLVFSKRFISTIGIPLDNVERFNETKISAFSSQQVPLSFLTQKGTDRISFRRIDIPFPSKYSSVLSMFKSRFQLIIDFLETENTLSNFFSTTITKNGHFSNIIDLRQFTYLSKDGKTISKNNEPYVPFGSRKEEMESKGYEKFIKIDIDHFYESIYTHTFAFIDGFDWVDGAIRKLYGNKTRGIATGPLISKVASEILLCQISNEINSHIKSYGDSIIIHRFADDFEVYSKDEASQSIALNAFKLVFKKFMLNVNESKFIEKDISEVNIEEIDLSTPYDYDSKILNLEEFVLDGEATDIQIKYFLSSTYFLIKKHREQLLSWTLHNSTKLFKFIDNNSGALPKFYNFVKKIDSDELFKKIFDFNFDSELVMFWITCLAQNTGRSGKSLNTFKTEYQLRTRNNILDKLGYELKMNGKDIKINIHQIPKYVKIYNNKKQG